jgi:hypothetical protein
MDTQLLTFAIILLLVCSCHIATTTIGIQCNNANQQYKEQNGSYFTFLISQLVTAILVTILAMVGIYFAVYAN